MSVVDKDILSLFDFLETNSFIDVGEIPNIDLYMDQVTRFFETQFDSFLNTEEEKILTKTMINNYVKHKVISAPERKKYAKDQVLLLIMVYFLKHSLSISDIKDLLAPLKEASELNKTKIIETIYLNLKDSQAKVIQDNKEAMLSLAASKLSDKPTTSELMDLIFTLSFQSSMNKQLAEILIHHYFAPKEK